MIASDAIQTPLQTTRQTLQTAFRRGVHSLPLIPPRRLKPPSASEAVGSDGWRRRASEGAGTHLREVK
jgi:hypothetical protein